MLTNRAAPHARVVPVLTVADVRVAVAFYTDVFGFGHQWVVTQTLVDTAPSEAWAARPVVPRSS